MPTPITLTTAGSDRATAYHMSNKIIRRSDGLFITWLDAAYRIMLARIDLATGERDVPFALAQGSDNHCGAALAATPDGRLHLMAGHHVGGFIHRWSATPAEPASWSLPEAVGVGATYPSLVCDQRGALHLTYRSSPSSGAYGMNIHRRPSGEPWSWRLQLIQAPAPLYSFFTNSLAVGCNGAIHLVVEFYKTYPDNAAPPHSMAVAHLESPDGVKWFYTDGREVARVPVGLEDTQPVRFRGGGNFRPGNCIVLPDNQPAFNLWDERAGTLEVAIRRPDRSCRFIDLRETLAEIRPGWVPNLCGQLAVDKTGNLLVVAQLAPIKQWGHPDTELHVIRVAPESGRVLGHQAIPKLTPGVPDWFASIEKSIIGLPEDDLYLIYTSGLNGSAQTAVRLLRLGGE